MGEVSGKIKEVGGEIRAKVDGALGDKEGAAQGRKDQAAGNIEKNASKVKNAIKDTFSN